MNKGFAQAARLLSELAQNFYKRGWTLGTSGNFSVVVNREPLRLAITASGVDKGRLTRQQVVLVGEDGTVLRGMARASAETLLHVAIVRARGAGAVLHTHSVWSTILSEMHLHEGGLAIAGYEMLKGLAGVTTHEHREWLSVIANSQDYVALAGTIAKTLAGHPDAHGILLHRHGLYTWGQDLDEAKRHAEILEFLMEVVGRMRTYSGRAYQAAS